MRTKIYTLAETLRYSVGRFVLGLRCRTNSNASTKTGSKGHFLCTQGLVKSVVHIAKRKHLQNFNAAATIVPKL